MQYLISSNFDFNNVNNVKIKLIDKDNNELEIDGYNPVFRINAGQNEVDIVECNLNFVANTNDLAKQLGNQINY